ncbi:MAG: TetR/AcrR family transcriptional regulator [Proteobacteria bacterium]|nr:TetR/AcrR family transcriptional regulator [Pseudomonadota bacterium]
MSDDKQQKVLDAAQAQFLRYGFRRVTMGDIATAANISRPALYLLFANKEAIFCAIFTRFANGRLAEIEAGIDDFPTVTEQLAFAVEIWIVQPYEMLHHTPEGRELVECSYGFATDVVGASYRRFEAILASAFAPYSTTLKAAGMSPATLAETFALALPGMKSGARNSKHLHALLNRLITIITAALVSPTPRTVRQARKPKTR